MRSQRRAHHGVCRETREVTGLFLPLPTRWPCRGATLSRTAHAFFQNRYSEFLLLNRSDARCTGAPGLWSARRPYLRSLVVCVSNPLSGPKFVLPIGFVQSPLLASLVLMRSPVADAIESAKNSGATISVYLDDIVGSHNDHGTLTAIYDDIRQACVTSNLIPNPNKLVSPTAAIIVFNCNLAHGRALVTEDRLAEFLAVPRTDASRQAFDQYRNRVAAANG
jgi:hypothetical protein